MKKIYQDLFHEFNFLTNLNESPDGSKLAFTVTKQNAEKNCYESHIYMVKDGKTKKLTSGKSESYFVFEDDTHILFASNRSEDKTVHTEFYRLDLENGGEAELAFSLPLGVSSIKDLGDKYLVQAGTDVNCPDYHLLTKEEQLAYEKEKEDNSDYQVVDEYPFMFNGAGFINKTRTSLYLVDKKTLLCTRIASATMDVESFDEKDGVILFSGIDYTDFKWKWSQVYKYTVATDTLETLYGKDDMLVSGVKFFGDEVMVFGTYGTEYGVTQSSSLWLLKDGVMESYIDKDISLHNSVGTDSKYGHGKGASRVGDEIYIITTEAPNAMLTKVAGKELKNLTCFKGTVCDYVVGKDSIKVIAMVGQGLQEVYEVNEDGSLKKLTCLNDEVLDGYYVAVPNQVLVKKESCTVEGWVLLPEDYDASKKYPAILDIHGGPRTSYGELYFHEMQYWASLGFVVMYCNPRGSDGYGNEFADIRNQKYGVIDLEDLMDFTDEVLKQYSVDEKRVAVTGGSYGGFMTNWIIGHTDRFCCAASQRSISNWMSMMCASDYGIDVPFEHGFDDINNCTKEVWRVSPLKYAQNVKTPTLFIHSFEDYRCPYPEGMQMYTAIRALGVDARMCLFKGENHELSRAGKPLHRSRRLKEITDWILKYTKE